MVLVTTFHDGQHAQEQIDDVQIQTDAGVDGIVYRAVILLSDCPVVADVQREQCGHQPIPEGRHEHAEDHADDFHDDDRDQREEQDSTHSAEDFRKHHGADQHNAGDTGRSRSGTHDQIRSNARQAYAQHCAYRQYNQVVAEEADNRIIAFGAHHAADDHTDDVADQQYDGVHAREEAGHVLADQEVHQEAVEQDGADGDIETRTSKFTMRGGAVVTASISLMEDSVAGILAVAIVGPTVAMIRVIAARAV